MKRTPRWLMWSLATVGLWAAWTAFVYMPLRVRENQTDATLADLNVKGSDQLRRIGMATTVVAQIDTSTVQLAEARQLMPESHDINAFLSHLSSLGREAGMSRVGTAPVLSSMMELRSGSSGTTNSIGLDTLIVELSGAGRFRSVGDWLDRIESEPAFRGWESCRWDEGDADGIVSFNGRVAILVVIGNGRAS